jgi:hypothetical protein
VSIESKPYYWLACDRCKSVAEYGDFSAMADASQAVEMAEDGEWLIVRSANGTEHHFCLNCTVWSDDEDCMVPITESEAPHV